MTRYRAASGPGGPAEALLQIGEQRREPPVEPDHEPVVAGPLDGGQDLGELLLGEGERLLHEDGLAALQRLAGQTGVRVVPRHDEHGVEGLVVQHRLDVRS